MEVIVSPAVTSAVRRLRTALADRFGPRLRDVVLYGSHARGTAHEESDVDVFVVVDALTPDEARDVARVAYWVNADPGHEWAGLEVLSMSTAHAQDMRARERLLLRDIDREGVRVA